VAIEPRDVIEELFRRGTAGEESVIDELIAEDGAWPPTMGS
jgi:hypothetical protein